MQINSLILAIHILSVEYESGFGVVIFLKAYMILHICSILVVQCLLVEISLLQRSERIKAKKEGRRYEYGGSVKGENSGFYQ